MACNPFVVPLFLPGADGHAQPGRNAGELRTVNGGVYLRKGGQ